MATNPATISTPHLRALIATGSMVILLALFGWLGYWYGNRAASDTDEKSGTPVNASATASGTNATSAAAENVLVVGKITKIQNGALEISTSTGDTTKTMEVTVASKTPVRKLDLRSIPKNGIGDGAPMQYAELKVGDSVVITSADTSTSKITATKVSKVIYP